MKKIISILLPVIAVLLVLVGCGKSSTMGEKKTVSEVDQLLTKKGQQFESEDDYAEFTVTKPYHLLVKDGSNGKTNNISLRADGQTPDKKYTIYRIDSAGDGSYSVLDGDKVIFAKHKYNGKDSLAVYSNKAGKLTTAGLNKFLESKGGIQLRIKN